MSTTRGQFIVVIDAPLPAEQTERIQQLDGRIKLVFASDHGGLTKTPLTDAEVIYTSGADFDPAQAPRLRWLQTNSAAVNQISDRPIVRTSVAIANVSGAYSTSVAECALGMVLAMTRRIPLGCRFQSERRWPEDYTPFQGEDLHGKTMGIVGYGSIGRQIARLAQALGMTILACKRRPAIRHDASYLIPGTGDPEGKIPKAWFAPEQIPEMFRQTDFAMITLPFIPSTKQLIGKRELLALPPHAYFFNMGRGPVVDEAALIECLQARRFAGAGLDVFAEEPLPPSSPLWKMDNVLIMPHIASWTRLQAHNATEVLIENLRRDLSGEPLVNVIEKKLMFGLT